MNEKSYVYSYTIDNQNRIIEVSPGWNEFAVNNGATEMQAEKIEGRILWNFISGPETQSLYQSLFEKVRADAISRTVPFRCDAPDRRRFMELTVKPLNNGFLLIDSVLLREEFRETMPLLSADAERNDEFICMCAWCKRVDILGKWFEVEEAVKMLDLFATSSLPQISHGMCQQCKTEFKKNANLPET